MLSVELERQRDKTEKMITINCTTFKKRFRTFVLTLKRIVLETRGFEATTRQQTTTLEYRTQFNTIGMTENEGRRYFSWNRRETMSSKEWRSWWWWSLSWLESNDPVSSGMQSALSISLEDYQTFWKKGSMRRQFEACHSSAFKYRHLQSRDRTLVSSPRLPPLTSCFRDFDDFPGKRCSPPLRVNTIRSWQRRTSRSLSLSEWLQHAYQR